MDREKSPGSDKLHADFHQIFRKDLSSVLINVLNLMIEAGNLSITQGRGIIKLILKKTQNRMRASLKLAPSNYPKLWLQNRSENHC